MEEKTVIKEEVQPKEANGEPPPVSNFRRALPQVLASSAKNLILFDNSLVLSFSSIVNAALLHAAGPLSFTSNEASWFSSISFGCQPVGSVLAGLFMEPLGRKRSMLLLNIPFFTAWILLYFAPDVPAMFVASAIMGLGVGCTEAPILTYVGEISEPRLRGVMTCYAQLCGALGTVVLYVVGAFATWQVTALFCAAVPVLTFLSIIWVPETPAWLISRGRIADAEKALCWLRGWVTPGAVKTELDELLLHQGHHSPKQGIDNPAFAEHTNHHSASSSDTLSSSSDDVKSDHSLKARIVYLTKPEMRRPLTIIILYFFFYYASGLNCMRPYFVEIFRNLHITMDHNKALVVMSIVGLIGTAVCMFSVPYTGKRVLSLISLVFCATSTLMLALVTLTILSSGWALPAFFALSFFTGLGAAPIPWMLQSELFPFKGRSLGSSIAAAISYLIGFWGTRTFLDLSSFMGLDGIFFLYTALSLFGSIYLYIYLPETEGRSLHDIESEFTDKTS